ncbi:MAG TPA: endonuclease MutS2 [Cyclobacteriaceae bacterium]
MIYPDQLEEKLGFDQVRHRLSENCLSPAAVRRVAAMRFLTDYDAIRVLLSQTLEFVHIIEKGEPFPAAHFHDPLQWHSKIFPVGNYLEEQELLDMAGALEAVEQCKSFLHQSRESCSSLCDLADPVPDTSAVTAGIHKVIDERGRVRDSASPELGRIRKRLREQQARLRSLSEQLFSRAVAEKWVPEGALPTIREGRVVIPILAEHKRKLRGFVLDESATGQTVFMEPTEMLDTNNEIREYEHAERREVVRILASLTDGIRDRYDELKLAFNFLTEIDFIRARAKFACSLEAHFPDVRPEPTLRLRDARHPLLFQTLKGKRPVVPLSIDLNDQDRMILVSGPNAGGKSVCLKTVGLLQYMLQCGLLIPAHPDSVMGVFASMFLDIGDQQSIENDLSTYSSHLKNMSLFIRDSDDRSLVLIDEMGSGTDPNFGGAIAQAVLEELLKKGVWGVVTTHYYNLKVFAGQREGIRNAAMRFDEESMAPLYILDIGRPGSSFALEIARTTGLPENTLEEARRVAGRELEGIEVLMRKLAREQQELQQKQEEFAREEAIMKETLKKYQTLYASLESEKKEILSRAKKEAENLLNDVNRKIEKTIRHIRENSAERKETLRVRRELQELKDRVRTAEVPEKAVPEFREGDYVRIAGQEGKGILQSIKGRNAVVQFGEIMSVVDLSKLEKASGSASRSASGRSGAGVSLLEKRSNFNNTLDLRGKRVDEAITLLDRFMDTAILVDAGELRILHGKGEGVLRKVVREQLRRYREVASVSDEHVERGGDGITVVVLK